MQESLLQLIEEIRTKRAIDQCQICFLYEEWLKNLNWLQLILPKKILFFFKLSKRTNK